MPTDERNEFQEKRILSAVHRGDMRTAERLLGPAGSADLNWGMTIALALFELERTAHRPRCRRAIENAYAGARLLSDAKPGENAATVLCQAVDRLVASGQTWGVLRVAERIAREGGGDERAVGLVARRVARAHGVTLAADLRGLSPDTKGPVSIVDLTLEELRRDGPETRTQGAKPLQSREDDEHAVNALGRAARHVTAAGETCRVGVTRHARFEYRARAEGMAARRRTRSTTSAQDQAARIRETIDAGLRRLYRAARLRHADATERPATAPGDATADGDGSAIVTIRHPNLRSFIARTARAAGMDEEHVVALAAESEIARAETLDARRRRTGRAGDNGHS